MRIAVTGSTGLVGSALVVMLERRNHEVVRLVRHLNDAGAGAAFWDPAAGVLDPAALAGVDAVVHLAGENIASGRWTPEFKARVSLSRTEPTRLIARTLASMTNGPRVFLSASAVGYYGHRGDTPLTEQDRPGNDFLASLCVEWESATRPASEAGVRVNQLRMGVVLSKEGGALAKMLPPFRMGLGGVIGNGCQHMSWISLHDAVRAIAHLLEAPAPEGPVNVTSPGPVTNRVFTRTLARVLNRPALFPVPAFAARLALGEMADAVLLSSIRVLPAALEQQGFAFHHPSLKEALRTLL
jgi:uncharacterized protein (TIGR01777 family)